MIATLAPPATAPERHPPRPASGFGLVDAGALFGLLALALAVRLPTLLIVPRFTDEQLDTLYTMPLYRLQALPVIGFDPYNGPLYSCLLATAYWLVGPQPYGHRLVPLALGCATVAFTYLLGRSLGGRVGGLVAAGLLLTSATHVIVNSHLGWSNATTPFFTTLAFLAILPTVTRGNGRRLALGALAFAVALQTHPSVIAFLPGVGLAVLLKRPRLVLSRWMLLAGALFVLGYANMIAYNLRPEIQLAYRRLADTYVANWREVTSEDTFARLSHEQKMNAETNGGPAAALVTNLGTLAWNLPRVAGSLVEPKPAWTDHLAAPTFWVYGAVVLLGLAWPLRHGNPLPLLAGGSFVLILAFLNGKYEPIFNGRYLMPLMPLAFAGFGSFAADLWRMLRGRTARLALAAALLALVAQPLWPLSRYLERNAPDGQVNLDLIQSAAAVDAARRPDERVVLDAALGRRNLPGDGDLLMNLRVFLELRNVPYQVHGGSARRLEEALGSASSAVVVFAQPYDRALEERYRMLPLEERTSGRYATYRLERR